MHGFPVTMLFHSVCYLLLTLAFTNGKYNLLAQQLLSMWKALDSNHRKRGRKMGENKEREKGRGGEKCDCFLYSVNDQRKLVMLTCLLTFTENVARKMLDLNTGCLILGSLLRALVLSDPPHSLSPTSAIPL